MTRRRPAPARAPQHQHYAAAVQRGLAPAAAAELRDAQASLVHVGEELITFSHPNISTQLPKLRLVNAVYAVRDFAVPRPKALLGDEHFRHLASLVNQARGRFTGLRIEAAGKHSAVMVRLGTELASHAGVPFRPDAGDLVVRIVRTSEWQVLVRLTPRPLSARPWRVCNIPGGLHAPLAVWLNQLAGATPRSRYVNLFAGSGTLAIEHALAGGTATAVEIAAETVQCLRENVAAAGALRRVQAVTADALAPHEALPAGTFDIVTADPPWGDAVGHHAQNEAVHSALVARAAELLVPGGTFALITHEVRMIRRVLSSAPVPFTVVQEQQVAHGGHHPLVLVLKRV